MISKYVSTYIIATFLTTSFLIYLTSNGLEFVKFKLPIYRNLTMYRGVPILVAQVARATPIFLSTERGNLGDFKFPRIPKLVSNTNNFDQITPLGIYMNSKVDFSQVWPCIRSWAKNICSKLTWSERKTRPFSKFFLSSSVNFSWIFCEKIWIVLKKIYLEGSKGESKLNSWKKGKHRSDIFGFMPKGTSAHLKERGWAQFLKVTTVKTEIKIFTQNL